MCFETAAHSMDLVRLLQDSEIKDDEFWYITCSTLLTEVLDERRHQH